MQALKREGVQVRFSSSPFPPALSRLPKLTKYLTVAPQYIVAPYEADPQLAYLEKCGLADGIITEDSDLLVFGCERVLFKLDGEGHCIEIKREDFGRCGVGKDNGKGLKLVGWTDVEFRRMAILSGCDYLKSVGGLGLKTANRLLRKYTTVERVRFDPLLFAPFPCSLTTFPTYINLTFPSSGTPISPTRRATQSSPELSPRLQKRRTHLPLPTSFRSRDENDGPSQPSSRGNDGRGHSVCGGVRLPFDTGVPDFFH